jgi:hypothetical protein
MPETPNSDDKQQPESNEPAEVDEERREGWKDEAGGRASTDSENDASKREEAKS